MSDREIHAIRRYSEHQMREFAADEVRKALASRPGFTRDEVKALVAAEIRSQMANLPRKWFEFWKRP